MKTGSYGLQRLADALGSGNRVDMEWMDDAACRQSYEMHGGRRFEQVVDPDEWATPRGEDDANVRGLRNVCATCPVRRPCLNWAFTSPHSIEFGVYGGSSGSQRMAVRTHADPVGELTRWMDGWIRARDKMAYERKERRKKWQKNQQLQQFQQLAR